MKHYDKLLFVDNSNTSLSPMAEAIAQKELLLEDILIESAGLVVLFPEPVNPKAEAVLAANSLSMEDHTSRPFSENDFDERTLIIAITDEIKNKILSGYPSPVNTVSLSDFSVEAQAISDPYGGSLEDYGQYFEQLRAIIKDLVQQLLAQDAT